MKSPKAPTPPDPVTTANAQSTANNQSAAYNAALNRFDEYTPLGSRTYTTNGTDPTTGAPIYRSDINLTPEGQQLYDSELQGQLALGEQANSMLGRLNETYGSNFDPGNLPERTGNLDLSQLPKQPGIDDFSADRQRVEDSTFGRYKRLLDPEYERQDENLTSRLANQGITQGSTAYDRERGRFSRERDSAYLNAADAALAAGGAEQSRLFGMGSQARSQGLAEALQAGQFGNESRGRALQESLALRSLPLNEYSAFRSGSQVQLPQFGSTAQVGTAPGDVQGNIYRNYQGALDQYNAGVAGNNALLSGLFSAAGTLGGAAIGASDKRLKTDIRKVGELPQGMGIYDYRFKSGGPRQRGVMAQEVEKVQPEAVLDGKDGYKRVDYRKVMSKALAG